ncbi:MAG: tail fiber domain-containing protein [Bacteroidetes bacterium]|nr:tail fiber domain-containing protein [Bacteroidota bacterium]
MSKVCLFIVVSVLSFSAFAQNVGIGTNSPQSKLHVAGCIRSDTLIGIGVRNLFAAPNGRIYDSLVVPATINWEIGGNSNITPANFLGTTNANDVIFKTNNIERARILSGGNIGINTTAPSVLFTNSALHSGDQSGLGTQVAMGMDWNANAMGYVSSFYNSGATAGSSGVLVKITDNTSNSKAFTVNAGALLSGTDLFTVLGNGNTGIGTNTPANRLEITSATANTSGLRFTNLTSASPTVASNGAALSVDVNGDVILTPSSANAWLLNGNAGTTAGTNFLGTTDAQDLVFKTNNTEHIRTLASNGFVGIGTPGPGAQLEVVLTSNTTAASISRFSRVGTGSLGWLSFFSGAAASDWNGLTQTGDKSFIFTNDNNPSVSDNTGLLIGPWTTAGNPNINSGIKIMENGNVGISVGVPSKKLEISSDANAALYAIRNFNGIANSDAGFIGGIDAAYTNTGVYFVQKDNVSLGSYGTNLMNIVSNGLAKVVVNGTGNMRIGNQFFNSQSGGVATANDVANVKFAVMGGYSSFGNYNSDPAIIPAAPDRTWINGVGSLVLGMNRQAGTSNVDFWNVTDPGNGAAALGPTDRGFNWRNFNFVAGSSVENLLMTLNGQGNLTIAGTNYFTSDQRLKTDVKPFENNILQKLMQLQPSTYTKHASTYDASGNIVVNQAGPSIQDFGFIAQDVYKIFPELVYRPKNESKELWSVDYARLSVMLTKALQEQQKVIESQEERIQKLENALNSLLESKK